MGHGGNAAALHQLDEELLCTQIERDNAGWLGRASGIDRLGCGHGMCPQRHDDDRE
jgi:hypothetical protein